MQHQERRFPASATSARAARRLVRDTLHGWRREQLSDTTELLTGELVTNALLHSGSGVLLRIISNDRVVRVEVADNSGVTPSLRAADEGSATGRGLQLVEALADRWGVDTEAGGKTVWFEVSA